MRRTTSLRRGSQLCADTLWLIVSLLVFHFVSCPLHGQTSQTSHSGPLSSWNDGAVRSEIIRFVDRVTEREGEDFVSASERIAVFDNDGTLWPEQPYYTQIAFAIDRATTTLAGRHELPPVQRWLFAPPEQWDREFFAALITSTHSGNVAEFHQSVSRWLATVKHPRFQRPYPELAYQPMLELMRYLENHDFEIWIVSGGDEEFLRCWAPDAYGVPAARIIGSTLRAAEVPKKPVRDKQQAPSDQAPQRPVASAKTTRVRLPEFARFNNDQQKVKSVQQVIGKRPLLAVGNSDGDLPLLQWVGQGEGPRLPVVIHHTDAQREWAYDRRAVCGKLDKALDAAQAAGWLVVDIRRDWRVIFPKRAP